MSIDRRKFLTMLAGVAVAPAAIARACDMMDRMDEPVKPPRARDLVSIAGVEHDYMIIDDPIPHLKIGFVPWSDEEYRASLQKWIEEVYKSFDGPSNIRTSVIQFDIP